MLAKLLQVVVDGMKNSGMRMILAWVVLVWRRIGTGAQSRGRHIVNKSYKSLNVQKTRKFRLTKTTYYGGTTTYFPCCLQNTSGKANIDIEAYDSRATARGSMFMLARGIGIGSSAVDVIGR